MQTEHSDNLNLSDEWAAGFFDAEGHIGVSRGFTTGVRGSRWVYHHQQIHVTQKVVFPLRYLQDAYGGIIRGPDTEDCYRWHLSIIEGENFLRKIYPHSLVKRKQIELAFQLRETRGQAGGYHPNPPEIISLRDSIWTSLKDYNQDRSRETLYLDWACTPQWLAGFFDGEGSVSICRCVGKPYTGPRCGKNDYPRAIRHYLTVNITQKTTPIINYLHTTYGGYVAKPSIKSSCYKWRVTTHPAYSFLSIIQPYSIVKKKQILLALAFREFTNEHGHVLSNEVIRKREEIRNAIMAANRERTVL